jgi:hypothetical protein
VRFLVDKVALGQLFSGYFGFPCQFSCTKFSLSPIYHTGL